jgi:hypothetical protein
MRKAREELEEARGVEAEAERRAVEETRRAAEAAQRAETAQRALSEALSDLLQTKFGPIPDEYRVRMAAADPATLQGWLKQALTAASLESVFGSSPPSP